MIEHAEQSELKLIKDDRHELDPIPLERRIAHRKPANGRITALLTMKQDDGEVRNRICSIQLRDMSDTGVGAFTDEPLPRDAKLTLFLPPHGPERGFDLYGNVARCESREEGYEVGIRLDRQLTACA